MQAMYRLVRWRRERVSLLELLFVVLWASSAAAKRVVCSGGQCFSSRVKVAIENGQGLLFCKLCRDARLDGSVLDVWEAHFRPARYDIAGELVYAVPNDASSDLLNRDDLRGNIALIDRGKVPIVAKVKRAQAVGAAGVIIVDDGDCDDDFDCQVLGRRRKGKGWSAQDHAERWRGVKIPSVLALKVHGDGIKRMMDLETMHLGAIGEQRVEAE